MNVHFSSETDLWSTPQDFFDKYDAIYQFKTDVCANAENAKCAEFYDKEKDGLVQDWRGSCWMNPPYGRGIGAWLKKAHESSLTGATVVCLVPARTDTAWWHDYCVKGDIEFIRGRLKFGGHKNSAPLPSAIVVFGDTALSKICFANAFELMVDYGLAVSVCKGMPCDDFTVILGSGIKENHMDQPKKATVIAIERAILAEKLLKGGPVNE